MKRVRQESMGDKIHRFRSVILVVSIPIALVLFVMYLMPRGPAPLPARDAALIGRKAGPSGRSRSYAVIFDAGSSGSRVHVYCFDGNLGLIPIGQELELFEQVYASGISFTQRAVLNHWFFYNFLVALWAFCRYSAISGAPWRLVRLCSVFTCCFAGLHVAVTLHPLVVAPSWRFAALLFLAVAHSCTCFGELLDISAALRACRWSSVSRCGALHLAVALSWACFGELLDIIVALRAFCLSPWRITSRCGAFLGMSW